MKVSIFSLKTEILLVFLRLGSKFCHSMIAEEKKIFFEKVMLCFNLAHSSCSIWCTSYMNDIKKVFLRFIFENFIKETKFSVQTTKLRDSRPNSC